MRLIDADALRKKAREMDLCAAVTVWDIDEAPTISPDTLRPKGRREIGRHCYECSICKNGYLGLAKTRFCPNCGADMREEKT